MLVAKAIAMAVPSEKSHSQYFQQLDSTVKARHLEKLRVTGQYRRPLRMEWHLKNKCRVV